MPHDRATCIESVDNDALCIEARYLHRQLFGREPSADLIKAYLRAHVDIRDLSALDRQQLQTVSVIVKRRLDAVGIEPWLRGGRQRHALSIKLFMLAYLAECDAGHPEFTRRSAGRVRAPLSMGLAVASALLTLLRGRMQKAWHGLV